MAGEDDTRFFVAAAGSKGSFHRALGFLAEPWGLLELRLSGIENGELAARERKDSLVRAIGESRQRVGDAASDAGRRDSPRSLIWGRSSGEEEDMMTWG